MDIKAIFLDIDGTIIPFGNLTIPQATKDALAEVQSNGIKVFIATGRHAAWLSNLEDFPFDGYVTVNGAMCTLGDKKTVIYSHPIDRDDIRRLVDVEPTLPLKFCLVPLDGNIFINGIDSYVEAATSLISVPPIPVEPLDTIGDRQVVQMMAFGDSADWSSPELYANILCHCTATSWNPYFCDIIATGCDKAKGIDQLLEYFNIPLEAAMAIGDGGNDISMISHCGVGIAMGNAADSVKNVAGYITDTADNFGVINALRHFNLIKKR